MNGWAIDIGSMLSERYPGKPEKLQAALEYGACVNMEYNPTIHDDPPLECRGYAYACDVETGEEFEPAFVARMNGNVPNCGGMVSYIVSAR